MFKIDGVIFDMDGTITDTIPLVCMAFAHTLKKYVGIDYTDEEIVNNFFGPADDSAIFEKVGPVKGLEAVDEYVKFYKKNHQKYVTPVKELTSLFDFLYDNNIKIGLFSGKGRKTVEISIEQLNIAKYFSSIVTGTEIHNPKPNPDGILQCLRQLNISPDKAIYVGDSEVDILAAKEAGTVSVGAMWFDNTYSTKIISRPDYCFTKIADFKGWLTYNI